MLIEKNKFKSEIPNINLEEQADMLFEFTAEALNLLMDAKNSVLALEAVPTDSESIAKGFKVFYSIKGLSGFLNLKDIQYLSAKSEEIFDLLRKDLLSFDNEVAEIILECIDTLRTLLDLLNEQISNQGKLKSKYFDISTTIDKVNALKDQTVSNEISKVIKDKRSIKIPSVSLPVSKQGDSRANILKKQQELVKERELAIKLSQQAQKAAAEKSDMLASMSHEMRTLINAIMGFSDLLIRSSLEDKQTEFLRSIRSSGELLLEIINNILDLAKVERGKLKLETIPFDLKDLIEDVFQIVRTRLEGKPISLFFDLKQEIPVKLKGDPTRLRQILINLLSNATKFTEKGEVGLIVEFDAEKEIILEPGKNLGLRFSVIDTGVGIAESRQKFIFEPFTQGDKTITREYGGTGLGLTISRSYVEVMGGKIWVESELEKGSQFIFTMAFPIINVDKKEIEINFNFDEISKKNTIIVDSDPHKTLEKTCRALSLNLGCLKGDSKKVLSQILDQAKQGQKPDLVFIDILTNKEEGYLLASRIKQEESLKGVKLVAVSANMNLVISSEAYKECFNDFLLRPIIVKELLTVLKDTFKILSPQDIEKQVHPHLEGDCKGIKVLIVDDSLTNIELIKAYFESIGCVGEYASNGQEAIEMIKKTKYDVCFMDLRMPVLNGFAAAQIIRQELSQDLPIVALTAADDQEDHEKCSEIGFNDFLTKPFNMDDFKDRIITYGRKQ
ncbi:MAG: response regulator [Candidatus Aceula lacicola]|nr:response regulator [Candidatus Aceula lacicola]